MKSKFMTSEDGNALLEGIAFLAVAVGLVLTLSLQVLDLERKQLALSSLARNSMRSYLVESRTDLVGTVLALQAGMPLIAKEQLTVSITCQSSFCNRAGELMWLRISADDLSALAYGIYID